MADGNVCCPKSKYWTNKESALSENQRITKVIKMHPLRSNNVYEIGCQSIDVEMFHWITENSDLLDEKWHWHIILYKVDMEKKVSKRLPCSYGKHRYNSITWSGVSGHLMKSVSKSNIRSSFSCIFVSCNSWGKYLAPQLLNPRPRSPGSR